MVPDSSVPRCGAWWRHGTSWNGAGRHPAHLSGSRAETRSSCLHPAARCPALLQERTQEQVTSLPITHTMVPGTPPQNLGHGGATSFAMQAKRWGTGSTFGGTWGEPPPLALVPPGVHGADSPPSPIGTNPSHLPSCAQHPFPCASPAASALKAIQWQLAFTWFPQDVMEPARIPPIQAWDGEGKPTSGGASALEESDAVARGETTKHRHSITRDPQPQQSSIPMDMVLHGSCQHQWDRAGGTFVGPHPLGGPEQCDCSRSPNKSAAHHWGRGLWGQLCWERETGAAWLPVPPLPETVPALGSPTVGRSQRTL